MQISHDKKAKSNESYSYLVVDDFGAAKISLQHSGQSDAFGRLRVAQVSTQLDIKQIHDKQPLFYDEVLIGTATSEYQAATSSTLISTIAEGDAVIRQTKQRGNYQSGKGQQIFITFSNFFSGEANITKRIGYFSSNAVSPYNEALDGIFIESDAQGVKAYSYRKGTKTNETTYAQIKENLAAQGYKNYDLNKASILCISYEWLGVGLVIIDVVIDGKFINIATFKNAGNSQAVYMQSPNQPIRYEIRQTGSGSGSLSTICATVGSEGSINEVGKILSDNLGATFINANSIAATYALIGIRLKAGNIDTAIDVLDYAILTSTATNILYKVILNPTVEGTFTYVDLENSSVQIAKGDVAGNPSTNTITGGTLLSSGYISAGGGPSAGGSGKDELVNAIRLGSNINGDVDTIVLAVQPLQANADVYAGITWRERT